VRNFVFAAVFGLSSPIVIAQPDLQERLKQVQADPVALKIAIDAGKKASFFCANCHGETGVSKISEVPNLAGQNPGYLLEQIRKFGSGERKDPFMQGLIKVLKDDERLQVTLFYANASVAPTAADPALVPKGKELFAKFCVSCHGPLARGNELYPRLAGQKQVYLKTSILRYRDNNGVRNNPLMATATKSLKDDEILAISHYLSQQP
jgi:cytochrome c553